MRSSLFHPAARLSLALLFSSSLSAGLTPRDKPSSYPDWWFERDVIPTISEYDPGRDPIPLWPNHYPSADDFAVVNGGQLKHIATQAVSELDARLPGGAGAALTNLVHGWSSDSESAEDFAALNLGQVKNVARVFYDRLIAANLVVASPWADYAGPVDDYALANIGQVKQLFSFLGQPAIRRVDDTNFSVLQPNDDSSTGLVPLGFTINFGGINFQQCYVNNNGNLTFEQPLMYYTPDTPLEDLYQPIIAAYWADVDTRHSATRPVAYGTSQVNGRPAFFANYFDVGYFSGQADKLNTFQIVLIDRSDVGVGDADIELNYGRIQWEWGAESIGSPARIGVAKYSASVEYTYSGQPGVLLDYDPQTGLAHRNTGLSFQRTNNSVPGRILIRVRNGAIGY